MTRESLIPVTYNVRLTVDLTVDAVSREDADRKARALIGDAEVLKVSMRRDWEAVAEKLLEDGMSHREVADTLATDRAQVSKRFPGTGWTRQEGVAYRNMKKQLEEMGDFV